MTRYRQGPPAGRGQVTELGGAEGGGRLREEEEAEGHRSRADGGGAEKGMDVIEA